MASREALELAADFLRDHDPDEEGVAEFAASLAGLLDLVAVSTAECLRAYRIHVASTTQGEGA